MTDRPAWRPAPGDVVELRAIPPAEFNPGVLDTYRHPAVKVGDRGTVEDYTQHDDGDETVIVRFGDIGLIVYPAHVALVERPEPAP